MTNYKKKNNQAQKRKNRSTGSTESKSSPEAKKHQMATGGEDSNGAAISPSIDEVWKVLMSIQTTTKRILEENGTMRELNNELRKLTEFNDKKIKELEVERDELKRRVERLESRVEDLTTPVKIEDITDDHEQYLRKYNLEFHGIPESQECDDEELILTIANALDVHLMQYDIDICHRLYSRKGNIPINLNP